ncbi:DUF1996 domain-containing protein [Actinomadura rupiterrae]|uniref:DUF1996 domain-containing protein n=1 Tax=Actinomadura rupiterrae TaxID=559627 RepID=UPI0020A5717A|nr:DUF1996 domain-containing protein [Actinomadura rupiterrae]MCP2338477.1 hypothetical protein [Actinomadura rupiterrae]
MRKKNGVTAVVAALVLVASVVESPASAETPGPSARADHRPGDHHNRTDQNGGDQNGGGANGGGTGDGRNGGGGGGGAGGGGGGDGSQVKKGPDAGQFADIRQAPPRRQPQRGRRASRGSFTSPCGRNQDQHHNPDNFIVAPGVSNGAHHIHDYVGNKSTDGFSTDDSLAAAGTTCSNGDKSAYFWPVMRQRGRRDGSGQAAQSQADGNVGRVVLPASARMQFLGNARDSVVPMPRFMRVITGDAKAATNGGANARAQWTCTGFTDRAFTDKYPLCPGGSRVTRILDFPSCWDGRNTDSANHRTHVVFPDAASGSCPQGTKAVPQLRMTLTYDLPARPLAFAVDTFPEQGHDPVTDHADFENAMPDALMRRAASCINSGRNC